MAVAVVVCLASAATVICAYRAHHELDVVNAGPVPDILHLLPANAPAIAYIDLAALRNTPGSPLAAILRIGYEEYAAAPNGSRLYDLVRDTGFDYQRDLDRAGIAFWPILGKAPFDTKGGGRLLVVAEGRFDRRRSGPMRCGLAN